MIVKNILHIIRNDCGFYYLTFYEIYSIIIMLRGRNPSYGSLVQLAERVTVNHYVVGSSPTGAALL